MAFMYSVSDFTLMPTYTHISIQNRSYCDIMCSCKYEYSVSCQAILHCRIMDKHGDAFDMALEGPQLPTVVCHCGVATAQFAISKIKQRTMLLMGLGNELNVNVVRLWLLF